MSREELLKIRNDIKDILIKNGTYCLCGRNEWCNGCSPSSHENKIFNKIMSYFGDLSK